jgi:transposase-like protein
MSSYITNNTIKKLSAYKQHEDVDTYSNYGIRALKCPDCAKKYLGQTGSPFRTRFKERLLSYKQQNLIQNSLNT